MSEIKIEDITNAVIIKNRVQKEAEKDPSYGFSDPFPIFVKKMLLINPQSYGSRLSNYFKDRVFKGESVSQSDDLGDIFSEKGFFEVKCSLITDVNKTLNIVQIRNWQNIDGYYCIAIDTRTFPYRIFFFSLTKEQMQNEVLKLGTNAHGTKKANKENVNVEKKITLKIKDNNYDFQRWCSLYLDTELATVFKSFVTKESADIEIALEPTLNINYDQARSLILEIEAKEKQLSLFLEKTKLLQDSKNKENIIKKISLKIKNNLDLWEKLENIQKK